jgi:hypothetical protein
MKISGGFYGQICEKLYFNGHCVSRNRHSAWDIHARLSVFDAV